MAKTPKPFSRKGLHKLECQWCDGFAYFTVPTLEARGLPRCGWCGEAMEPATLELALELGQDDSPIVRELRDRTEDKESAQLWSLGRNRAEMKRWAGTLNSMADAAFSEIVAETRLASDRRRRRRIPVEPMPF
jgi:hypothetical protein